MRVLILSVYVITHVYLSCEVWLRIYMLVLNEMPALLIGLTFK